MGCGYYGFGFQVKVQTVYDGGAQEEGVQQLLIAGFFPQGALHAVYAVAGAAVQHVLRLRIARAGVAARVVGGQLAAVYVQWLAQYTKIVHDTGDLPPYQRAIPLRHHFIEAVYVLVCNERAYLGLAGAAGVLCGGGDGEQGTENSPF